MSVDIRFLHGGCFYLSKGDCSLSYRRGEVYVQKAVDPDLLSRMELLDFIKEGIGIMDVSELWFCSSGTLQNGLHEIKVDNDILRLCESGERTNTVDVYVVQGTAESPHALLDFSNGRRVRSGVGFGSPTSKPIKIGPSNIVSPNVPPPSAEYSLIPTPLFENSPISRVHTAPAKLQPKRCLKKPPKTTLKASKTADALVDESSSDEGEILGSDSSEDDSDDDSFVGERENVFEDDAEDDELFDASVDPEVHDENICDDEEDDVFDVRVDQADYRSFSGSDDAKVSRYIEFNPLVDFKHKISLKSGMIFGSNVIFRKALRQYALENGFDYYYLHNDGTKVSAYCLNKCECVLKHGRKYCKCKENLCSLKACARKMGADGSFQLKTWNPEHVCGWQERNTKLTSVWLGERYLEHYREDSQWRLKSFIATVKREYLVDISYHQAWRARMRALLMTEGFAPEQYAMVWQYAATCLKWNPGSSVYVKPEVMTLGSPEKPLRFQRFYVCLKACKDGFKKGCRPIVGLDGCHLKGVYTGQVLTAVSTDGNENIFPLAYAVVESETKETWCWFLEILVNDIGTEAVTFMSDRQKGLIEALSLVAPMADTRVCIRHMHNNFKKKWPGKSFKDAVWAAAKSSTIGQFEQAMKVIKDMDEGAFKYLMNQHPSTWSLHAFKYYAKSDMLLNNACESFNSCILEAREMPILSMCEWIRRKLMKMFIKKRNKMMNHQGFLTPVAWNKLEELKAESLYRCKCIGDGDSFEVDSCGSRYVVDLKKRICGCNMWELTGLPCPHAICCILKRRLKLENFVHEYYHKVTYLKAYELSVHPMPGQDQWEKSNQTPLDPPRLVIQPGRPKKKRKREAGEEKKSKSKTTRVRFGKNKCGNCGEEGHTRKICKNPHKEPEARKKNMAGRPVSDSTIPSQPQKRKYTKRQKKTPVVDHEESSIVDQLLIEQDPGMQTMIENAMDQNESHEVVIPTQQSQTTMSLSISQSIGQTTQPTMPRASGKKMKTVGVKPSSMKTTTRSYTTRSYTTKGSTSTK